VRTLPLTSPKGGSKSEFVVFVNTIQVQSNKVCYKVSLCENSQRQSCSRTIPLSNGVYTCMLAVNVTLKPPSLTKADCDVLVPQPYELAKSVGLGPLAFQRAKHKSNTLFLNPQMGVSETRIRGFTSKTDIISMKLCYKVFIALKRSNKPLTLRPMCIVSPKMQFCA